MSRSALEDFRAVLAALSGRAQGEVEAWFRRTDVRDAATASRVMQEVLPSVIAKYGDVAAVAALDYFESIRADSAGRRTAYSPGFADPIPLEQAQASTRWAVGGLFAAPEDVNPETVLANLQKVADRLTKAQGRDTLAAAIAEDPDEPRFARIPRGLKTCRFCTMLASRGAVYVTEETAGGLSDWHDLCDCAVQQVYEGGSLPAGYDPDFYRQRYADLGGADIDLATRDFGSLDTAPGALPSTPRAD